MTSLSFDFLELEASFNYVNNAALIFYDDADGSQGDTDKYIVWDENY